MGALLVGFLVQQAHWQGTEPRFSARKLVINLHFLFLYFARLLETRLATHKAHRHTDTQILDPQAPVLPAHHYHTHFFNTQAPGLAPLITISTEVDLRVG